MVSLSSRAALAKQRGFFMLTQLAIVTMIAMIAMSGQLWMKRQHMLASLREAQGTVLRNIGHGYNQYMVNHYNALLNEIPIAGVANSYAPTIAELQAIGDLDQHFQATSLFRGLTYEATILRVPAGCRPPACNISGLVYINGPITDPSTGQIQPLGDALEKLGGDGAFSDSISPGTLYGPNGGWSAPNPMGDMPGVLAMRIGYGTSGFAQFVRRDGSMPMEGDLSFKGQDGTQHNLNNVLTLNAASANLTSNVYVQGDAQVDGRLSAGEYIQIDGIARLREYCEPDGLVSRDEEGLLLSCQQGMWQPAGDTSRIYYGSNRECPAGQIPLAKNWIEREALGEDGLRCKLPIGWGSNMKPFCEACAGAERCQILYSTKWNAVYCK